MKINPSRALRSFASVLLALPALGAQNEIIVNGGFESAAGGWTLSGSPAVAEIASSGGAARTGTNYLSLGGVTNATQAASQSVTLPTNVSAATLIFYYNITSQDGGAGVHDTFSATLRDPGGTVLATIGSWSNTNRDAGPGNPYYHQVSFDLLPYSGQPFVLHFSSTNDADQASVFRVDDVSLLVSQTNCWYRLGSSNTMVYSYGETNSFLLYAPSGCLWHATSLQSWIHTSSSGIGDGILSYVVDRNTSAISRTGTITVGDQAFAVHQASTDCSTSLYPVSSNHSAANESGNFFANVHLVCVWCAYTVQSWLHTTTCGDGPGIVNYTVDANSSTNARTGIIVVNGQYFIVAQAGVKIAPPLVGSQQGLNLTLSWPTNDPAFRLEFATNFSAANWAPVPDAPAIVDGRYTITESMTNALRFFRLKK